jgi:hypothetical protein
MNIAVFGSTQISVALDNADLKWIQSTIPEPTSAYLLGFGILGTLVVSGIQAKRKKGDTTRDRPENSGRNGLLRP